MGTRQLCSRLQEYIINKGEILLCESVLELGELPVPLAAAVEGFPLSDTFFRRLEKGFSFFSSTLALLAGDALAVASI